MVGFLLPILLCNAFCLVYQMACLPSGIIWSRATHAFLIVDCKFFLLCYSLLLLSTLFCYNLLCICHISPFGCVVVGLLDFR
jgi:hypothetical protein